MYLPRRVPVELPAGTYFNGRCLTEAETVHVNACAPGIGCLIPKPIYDPCKEVTDPLCDCMTDALGNLEINLGDVTIDNQGVIDAIEALDLNVNVGDITVPPIEFPKQYDFTGELVGNKNSPYCGKPFVLCDGALMILDSNSTPPLIPIPEGTDVSTEFEPYVPGQAADICLEAQCSLFEVTPGMSGTVESIIAAMIVEKGLVYTPEGKAPIPVTPEDAVEFTIRRKPCNAETSDGSIVVADYVEIDGHKQIRWTDPKQGGVDLAVEVKIPETGCSLATVCFENCISKADYAALPAGEKAAEEVPAPAPERG